MNGLKNIALFLTLLLASSGYAQKYFKVLDATSTSFAGGIPQNGSGTSYHVVIKLLTNQKVTFSDIWIGKEYGEPETASFSYSDGRQLVKGDTVLIRYTIHHYPAGSPLNNITKPAYKSPPIPMQGEALLGFSVGSTKRYRSVEKFRAMPPANYP